MPGEMSTRINRKPKASTLFFFNGQALFLGQGTDTNPHIHHALQIAIGLKDEFKILWNDQWNSTRFVVIDADVSHQLTGPASGQAILLLEPGTRIAENIRKKYLHNTTAAFPKFEQVYPFVQALGDSALPPLSCKNARTAMTDVIKALVPEQKHIQPKDPRILKILAHLENLEEKKISLSGLSHFISLSESRLVHLFKEETGIPIRRYLLWLRLMEALYLILGNASFTRAAHETGFADSAHLSRTFKQMFGIPPNQILKNSQFVQAISCPG